MKKKEKGSKPAMSSAQKRSKTNEKARLRNKSALSKIKTAIKKTDVEISNDVLNSEATLRQTISHLDRAGTKKLISKQRAARIKARLTVKFNNLKKVAAEK